MKLISIMEAGMGAVEYPVPKNPKHLMADFYLLDFLKHGDIHIPGERTELIEYEIVVAEKKLLQALKRHLLTKVGYAVLCELIHIIDRCEWNGKRRIYPKWVQGSDEIPFPEEHLENIHAYLLNLGMSSELYSVLVSYVLSDTEDDYPDPNSNKIQALQPEAVNFGTFLFNNGEYWTWMHEYGGPRWAMACQIWVALYNANSDTDIRMLIDRIYQLQHNTGNLLNKNAEYCGKWVQTILDIKFNMRDPEELIRFASPFVKVLGTKILTNKYGRGWDQDKFGDLYESMLHVRADYNVC